VAVGEQIRLGGSAYAVQRSGSEVQRLYVAADSLPQNQTALKTYRLRATHSGSTESTRCLNFRATADEVAFALGELDMFFKGVEVSRTGAGEHGNAYLYSIYFGTGANGAHTTTGDVAPLRVDSRECAYKPASYRMGGEQRANFSNMTGLDIGVETVVQGGATEHQTVSLALDAGYLQGAYFKLAFGKEETACLNWGAPAHDIEHALHGLQAITDQVVGVLVDLRAHDVGQKTLRVSNSSYAWRADLQGNRDRRPHFDGKVFAGDRIRVNGSATVYTVASVSSDGRSLQTTRALQVPEHFALDGASLSVVRRGVAVARRGLGNATVHTTVVQVVADAQLTSGKESDALGLFKLQLTHDGVQRQTKCLAYAASALAVEAAIDSLGFDFNQDGLANDVGHVAVIRRGDGSAAWGHGYEYEFKFAGPDNNRAHHGFEGSTSTVLGGNAPRIQVVGLGSRGGCQDASGPETLLGVTATTKHNSTNVYLSASASSAMAPGDRIRIAGTDDAHFLYTVAETATFRDSHWLRTLEEISCESASCGHSKKVFKSNAGAPSFAVRDVQHGRDVWTYDVFFAGPHHANVAELRVLYEGTTGDCASGWEHHRGRARDVRIETVQEGGSFETQTLTMKAKRSVPTQDKGYFVLFINYFLRVDASPGGACFNYGVPAEELQTRFEAAVNRTYNDSGFGQFQISRKGFNDATSNFGYEYTIDYVGSLMHGNMAQLMVVHNDETFDDNTQYFNRFSSPTGLNDLLFTGTFAHAPMSATYTIEMTSAGSPGVSSDAYVLTRHVGNNVETYQEKRARTTTTPVNYDGFTDDGIYFAFGSTTGHAVGDTWVLQIYYCDDDLPDGAQVHAATLVQGGIDPLALTFAAPVQLEGYQRSADGWRVPQLFTVREPQVNVQTITVKDEKGGGFSRSAAYRLRIDDGFNGTLSETPCLAYDAQDFEVEKALDDLLISLYSAEGYPSSGGDGVTVTRRKDVVFAPNGYVYSVYFDGFVGPDSPSAPTLYVNASNCSGTWQGLHFAFSKGESVVAEVVQVGDNDRGAVFTDSIVPLGAEASGKHVGRYLGAGGSNLGVYKLSGSFLSVAFDEALGDLVPMVADGSELAAGARVIVRDDLVQGAAATGIVLEDLHTGLPYSVRVAARNVFGYSNYSATAVGTPSKVPNPLESVVASVATQVYEVQSLTLGARHVDEVQVVTTKAETIFEVQEITVAAPFGGTVAGNFSVFFADAAVVVLSAESTIQALSFRLNFTFPYRDNATGHVNYTEWGTDSCLDHKTTAAQMQAALQAVGSPFHDAGRDTLTVTRTGAAGAASNYGYQWTIEYTGIEGALPKPRVEMCGEFRVVGGFNAIVAIAAAPDRYALRGLGTSTPVADIIVGANARIAQGQFRIVLADETLPGFERFQEKSDCVHWDASESQVEAALEGMANVDSARVVRHAIGAFAQFGYRFEVFFDGHSFAQSPVPKTMYATTDECVVLFATEVYGVLDEFNTGLDKARSFVNVTFADLGGKDLKAADDSARGVIKLRRELERLPALQDVLVQVETSDLELGLTWTTTIRDPVGDILTMSCLGDATFEASDAACLVNTVIDGNVLDGTFTLAGSDVLKFDASAAQVQRALSETYAGIVEVTREGPDPQRGYAWAVTFVEYVGNAPQLTSVASLTGAGASLAVSTRVQGNELGGTFGVRTTKGFATEQLPFSATAKQLEAALKALPLVGSVAVTKSGDVSTEYGAVFRVTFSTAGLGDVDLLIPETFALAGVGASIKAREVVKGSVATGTRLAVAFEAPRECSESQVTAGSCGSEVLYYEIQTSTAAAFDGNDVTNDVVQVDTALQTVRIGAATFDRRTDDFETPGVSGHFRLAYQGAVSVALEASASAETVRHALESLQGVGTVKVVRARAPRLAASASCVATAGFPTIYCASLTASNAPQPADLIYVGGSWYRVGISYAPGGDARTIPLATDTDSRVATTFAGATAAAAHLFGWGGGYQWEVEFLSTARPRLLSSPSEHDLVPVGASLAIRPADCDDCLYVGGLDAFSLRYVRGRAVNALGAAPYSGVGSATPQRVPEAPSRFAVDVTSGHSVQVYWYPPATVSGTIIGYSIQWDDVPTFVDAALASASCFTIGYGDCLAQGAVIAGTPPFTFPISGLVTNTTYFFRIAARNELYDASDGADTAQDVWSEVVSATPRDRAPLLPLSPVLTSAGRDVIQATFSPPLSDGGGNISRYVVEYDTSARTYNSAFSGKLTILSGPALEKTRLYAGGPYVIPITGLTPGVLYYARVAAVNDVGQSAWAEAATAVQPEAAPLAPSFVALQTAAAQAGSAITSIDVAWAPSTEAVADGGAPITAYRVEWFTEEAICETQLLRATWKSQPKDTAGFILQFTGDRETTLYGVSTAKLAYDVTASKVRDALMNLGHTAEVPYDSQYPAGFVEVTRTSTNNFKGYAWTVTFADCGADGANKGDQTMINIPVDSVTSSLEVDVVQLRAGRRPFGSAEEQIVRVFGTPDNGAFGVLGFFRLGFFGSQYSVYLPAAATAEQVESALELLPTVAQVSVVRSAYAVGNVVGYEWRITFLTNVGDQPALFKDDSFLFSSVSGGAYSSEVVGAANVIDVVTGLKIDDTVIGEPPARYMFVDVDADERSYTIPGLESGISYFVRVTARNSHGLGETTAAQGGGLRVPQQVPDPPKAVALTVHPGDDDALEITFNAPLSDGGATVTSYVVELDPTDTFDDPIREIIHCPANNLHAIWQISTTGDSSSNPIIAGSFALELAVNGFSETTAAIPYDAVAEASDEVGVFEVLKPRLTVYNGSNTAVASTAGSLAGVLFTNDIVRISTQGYAGALYRVNVTGDAVNFLDPEDETGVLKFPFFGTSSTSAVLTRVGGGRGTIASSRVFCEKSASYCDKRAPRSGSLQSKLQALMEQVPAGVNVSRYGPTASNGFTWLVTFRDDSPTDAALAYSISLASNGLLGANASEATGLVSITQVQAGASYTSCTGTAVVVPSSGGLVNGLLYYGRVTAYNSEGYSLPQAALAPEKPMVPPGRPTSVVLSTSSATSLRVIFAAPADDGGDDVTSYKVEYATKSDFSDAKFVTLTQLDGGTIYKTIFGLVKGQRYFVRVSAANSQGFGEAQASSPTSAAPYEESKGPAAAKLGVTSDSMLTVGYSYPSDDGGDAISAFLVEWDVAAAFNSVSSANKGAVSVDANAARSYTIDALTVSTTYYVRVKPINAAGFGAASVILTARPAVQVPGVPRAISVASGAVAGSVDVAWNYPLVPHHGIACGGFALSPAPCPVALGGSLPESTGGAAISEYEVQWNENDSFDGSDGGSLTTTATSTTISSLTKSRVYFVRILARNAAGSGAFCEKEGDTCIGNALSAVATAAA